MSAGFNAAAPALVQELFTRIRLLERVVAALPGAVDVDLGPIIEELHEANNVAGGAALSDVGARRQLDEAAARFTALARGRRLENDSDFGD